MAPPPNTIKLTAQAKARLEALSNSQPVRNLAALFFEFMAPNHRHPSCKEYGKKQYWPVVCGAQKKMGHLPQHYWNAYHCEAFGRYVEKRLWTIMDARDTKLLEMMPTPAETPFDDVYTELRRSYAICPWLHSGNNQAWVISNAKVLNFTVLWLMADDNLRRRPVLQFDKYRMSCNFTKAYADMIFEKHVKYEQLIQERMEHLDWVTGQPLKMNNRQYKKHNVNFQLTQEDAIYMMLLYQRQPQLRERLLVKFGFKESDFDPEVDGPKLREPFVPDCSTPPRKKPPEKVLGVLKTGMLPPLPPMNHFFKKIQLPSRRPKKKKPPWLKSPT